MEGQTLSEKSEKMIEAILESYKEYPVTVRMDTENIVNKSIDSGVGRTSSDFVSGIF